MPATSHESRDRARNLLLLSTPALWPVWPFLPLVRRCGGGEQFGLLYDGFHLTGRPGSSATVFLCNLFEIPAREADFLALPREAYDTAEEIYAGGWRVD